MVATIGLNLKEPEHLYQVLYNTTIVLLRI